MDPVLPVFIGIAEKDQVCIGVLMLSKMWSSVV